MQPEMKEGRIPGKLNFSKYISKIKYDTNELIYKMGLTDTENRLWLARRWRGGGRINWEFGVSRCKLLHIG